MMKRYLFFALLFFALTMMGCTNIAEFDTAKGKEYRFE